MNTAKPLLFGVTDCSAVPAQRAPDYNNSKAVKGQGCDEQRELCGGTIRHLLTVLGAEPSFYSWVCKR